MRSFIKGFLLSLLIFNLSLSSSLDELIAKNDKEAISKLLQRVKIVNSELKLPSNPNTNDLVIVEDEYNLKTLYEYSDKKWISRDDKIVVELLNKNSKNSYQHLFNYKIQKHDFNSYVSDDFKNDKREEKKEIMVKIIQTNLEEKEINIKLKELNIDSQDIINIDIDNGKIFLFYKK